MKVFVLVICLSIALVCARPEDPARRPDEKQGEQAAHAQPADQRQQGDRQIGQDDRGAQAQQGDKKADDRQQQHDPRQPQQPDRQQAGQGDHPALVGQGGQRN